MCVCRATASCITKKVQGTTTQLWLFHSLAKSSFANRKCIELPFFPKCVSVHCRRGRRCCCRDFLNEIHPSAKTAQMYLRQLFLCVLQTILPPSGSLFLFQFRFFSLLLLVVCLMFCCIGRIVNSTFLPSL